jgi:glycosyltransferase involved in cell wall biosynthesis
MQLAAAASAGGVVVVQVTPSAKLAGLTSFLWRVREFVARMRATRRPDSLEDAGSAGSPSVPASAPAEPAAPPATGPAEPYAGTGETRDAAREDATPVQHEHFADAKPAEASEDASPPEPVAVEAGPISQQEAKRGLDLDPSAPVVLFAGDLSYEGGADILLDAIVTVCGGNHEAQFLFAGDGAMRGELQAQASRAGLERRCRFLGHVPADSFDRVLTACDFVVIPARVRQGEDLARMAVANGKPVVTTHQAGIGVIVHGRNGLVTYDNPGSFVWGIRALLGPLYADLRRHLAETA